MGFDPDAVDPNLPTIDDVEKEILRGMPNERDRLDSARVARNYFNTLNRHYIPRREAEEEADYLSRPKRVVPFLKHVVTTLCKHLYAPGPGRHITGDDAATDWLNGVYDDCLMNSLCQRADRLALLGGAAAFQVAATGDPARPLKYHLWGADEFAVYPEHIPDPTLAVTIDRVNNKRTYTLWSADEIRVYQCEQWDESKTSGCVNPVKVPGLCRTNPYGVLPFAFFHAELPVMTFWEGSLGDYLVHANRALDDELTDLAHGIKRYLYPIGVAENCDTQFQVVSKFGAFVKLVTTLTGLDNAPPPKLSYLQAQLDVAGGWTHIENTVYQCLDALGIPRVAWRMDALAAPSGSAIIAEQAPLLDRAKERREPARLYERNLGRVSFAVAGAYYGDAAKLQIAADFKQQLTWPEPRLAIPGADRDEADATEIESGYCSRVMKIQERYGLSRDQAIERLKQIAKDNEEANAIDPPQPAPGAVDLAQAGQQTTEEAETDSKRRPE
jgi:hypothetical protein